MNRIKGIFRVLLAVAIAVAACSCIGDKRDIQEPMLRRAMHISIDDNGDPASREAVKSLRVIVFDNASGENPRLDRNELLQIDGAPGQGTGLTVTELEVNVNNDKMVAVILNEPSVLAAQLAAIRQPWELEEVWYNLSEFRSELNNGDGTVTLPMTGVVRNVEVTEANDTGNPKNITISVERIMSRVDVYLRAVGQDISLRSSSSMILLRKSYLRGWFAAGTEYNGTRDWNIPPASYNFGHLQTVSSGLFSDIWAPASDETITVADGAVLVNSFYTAERTCFEADDADKLELEFIGVHPTIFSTTYIFKEAFPEGSSVAEPITILKRNNIYKLTANIKTETVEFENSVVPWVEEDHGIIIDPQYYLRVSRDSFTVSGNTGSGQFTAETNYDKNEPERGFKKGITLGGVRYYDTNGNEMSPTDGLLHGWLDVQLSGAEGDMSRTFAFSVTKNYSGGSGAYYATVGVTAGNLTKNVKITRSPGAS